MQHLTDIINSKTNAMANHPSTKLAKKLKSKHPKVLKPLLRKSLAPLVMVGPGTIATIIKKHNVQVREHLKILIFGAQQVEILDNCSWYQLVPDILQKHFEVQTVAYGRNINEHTMSQAPRSPKGGSHHEYHTFSDLIAEHDLASFDIAVSFTNTPTGELELDDQLLIRQLSESCVPVFITHFTQHTAMLKALPLTEKGFYVDERPHYNFYALPANPNNGLMWGSYITALKPSRKKSLDKSALGGHSIKEVYEKTCGMVMTFSENDDPTAERILHDVTPDKMHLLHGLYWDKVEDILIGQKDDLSSVAEELSNYSEYRPTNPNLVLENYFWALMVTQQFYINHFQTKEAM